MSGKLLYTVAPGLRMNTALLTVLDAIVRGHQDVVIQGKPDGSVSFYEGEAWNPQSCSPKVRR